MEALALVAKASGRHSLYKGVTLYKPTLRWRAQISHGGRTVTLGDYSDEGEAARVFDRACICKYGRAAVCNFPLEDYAAEIDELHGLGMPALLTRLKEERQRKKEQLQAAAARAPGGGGGASGNGSVDSGGSRAAAGQRVAALLSQGRQQPAALAPPPSAGAAPTVITMGHSGAVQSYSLLQLAGSGTIALGAPSAGATAAALTEVLRAAVKRETTLQLETALQLEPWNVGVSGRPTEHDTALTATDTGVPGRADPRPPSRGASGSGRSEGGTPEEPTTTAARSPRPSLLVVDALSAMTGQTLAVQPPPPPHLAAPADASSAAAAHDTRTSSGVAPPARLSCPAQPNAARVWHAESAPYEPGAGTQGGCTDGALAIGPHMHPQFAARVEHTTQLVLGRGCERPLKMAKRDPSADLAQIKAEQAPMPLGDAASDANPQRPSDGSSASHQPLPGWHTQVKTEPAPPSLLQQAPHGQLQRSNSGAGTAARSLQAHAPGLGNGATVGGAGGAPMHGAQLSPARLPRAPPDARLDAAVARMTAPRSQPPRAAAETATTTGVLALSGPSALKRGARDALLDAPCGSPRGLQSAGAYPVHVGLIPTAKRPRAEPPSRPAAACAGAQGAVAGAGLEEGRLLSLLLESLGSTQSGAADFACRAQPFGGVPLHTAAAPKGPSRHGAGPSSAPWLVGGWRRLPGEPAEGPDPAGAAPSQHAAGEGHVPAGGAGTEASEQPAALGQIARLLGDLLQQPERGGHGAAQNEDVLLAALRLMLEQRQQQQQQAHDERQHEHALQLERERQEEEQRRQEEEQRRQEEERWRRQQESARRRQEEELAKAAVALGLRALSRPDAATVLSGLLASITGPRHAHAGAGGTAHPGSAPALAAGGIDDEGMAAAGSFGWPRPEVPPRQLREHGPIGIHTYGPPGSGPVCPDTYPGAAQLPSRAGGEPVQLGLGVHGRCHAGIDPRSGHQMPAARNALPAAPTDCHGTGTSTRLRQQWQHAGFAAPAPPMCLVRLSGGDMPARASVAPLTHGSHGPWLGRAGPGSTAAAAHLLLSGSYGDEAQQWQGHARHSTSRLPLVDAVGAPSDAAMAAGERYRR